MFVKIESDETFPYRIISAGPSEMGPSSSSSSSSGSSAPSAPSTATPTPQRLPEYAYATGGQFHVNHETLRNWERIFTEYTAMQEEMCQILDDLRAWGRYVDREPKRAATPQAISHNWNYSNGVSSPK